MQNAQPRLTVLTYNVWFDNFEFDRRVAEILRLVEASRPDVVLLQEVLPEFVDAVFAQPVRARPGRLSALSVFHSETVLYGVFCMSAQGA